MRVLGRSFSKSLRLLLRRNIEHVTCGCDTPLISLPENVR